MNKKVSKKSGGAKPKQYRIRSMANNWQQPWEGAYESEAEAEVVISEARMNAVAVQRNAELRLKAGKPEFGDEFDLRAVARFDEAKYAVYGEDMSRSILRLNVTPSESSQLVREINFKLRAFSEVELCWTCTGHTRAEMQGEASAEWLIRHGYIAEVQPNGDVIIRNKKGGR